MKSQLTHPLANSLLLNSWETAYKIGSGFALGYGLVGGAAHAQITIDNTTPTVINPSVAGCAGTCITGGLRDGNSSGPNVFHSFSDFNISNGQTVTFDRQPGVTNIFSHVSGLNASTINGTLSVNSSRNNGESVNSSANLFLLNSNGIIFGSNANLNVPESFLASTADNLIFQNGGEFSTVSPAAVPSLLNINIPIGLQLGSVAPSAIQIQGNGATDTFLSYNRDFTINRGTRSSGLVASSGKTLALIGGDVIVQGGNLASDSGHIEIGSLGKGSNVAFTPTVSGWNFDYSDTEHFQDISLSQYASIEASGDDAGSVQLQGRQIDISGGSGIISNVATSGNGEIAIHASDSLNLTGVNFSRARQMQSVVYVEISPGALGDGNSQISIHTPDLNLEAGAQIGLSMAGTGSSGTVDIAASNIVVNNGSNATPSSLFAAVLPVTNATGQRTASGIGGNLNINGGLDSSGALVSAEQFRITNGASVSTETNGPGYAGQLNINAKDITVRGFNRGGPSTLISASRDSVSGNGGEIDISTERLVVAAGGQVSVSTNSVSMAGNLNIQASESVELRGAVTQGRSGLFALARERNGAGGNIEIITHQLSLLEGATINASNFSSTASGRPAGTGPAGSIEVTASAIALQDDSLITTDTVAGDRANITLRSDSLVLRRGSRITTNANTRTTTTTGTPVVTGSATGGNINITTQALIALEDSDITANASNNFGGRIVVTADTILGTAYRQQLTSESDITASSDLGPAFSGSVQINSLETDPTNGLIQLPESLASTNQIVAACEHLESNTFVATGRGGLPENASQLTSGESIWNDFRSIQDIDHLEQHNSETAENTHKTTELSPVDATTETPTVIEAQTWSMNHAGKVVLGIYTTAPAAPQYLSGCHSHA